MATYREIHGKTIKSLSTDPSAETDAGQIWYNTASDTFKSIVSISAWSSGSPLINSRRVGSAGGTGIQTAALAVAGYTGTAATNLVEEYNGSGWATGGNYPGSINDLAAAGTQTAGLGFGGNPGYVTTTAEYNGSSWTAGNALNLGRTWLGGSGTQTAALGYAGYRSGGGVRNVTEEYDGTNWTSGNVMGTARYVVPGTEGTQTASFCAGGLIPPSTVQTINEEYDGTNWTAGTVLPSVRWSAAGAGTLTAGLIAGGASNHPATTLLATSLSYDGTTWAATPNLATARNSVGGAGASSSSAVVFGGMTPSITSVTEEYSSSANVITASAWSAGGAAPSGLAGSAYAGTKETGQTWGGDTGTGPWPTASFEYNGTSWTSSGSIPKAANGQGRAGISGPAVLSFGHAQPGTNTETWEGDGSSWTTQNALNTGRGFYGTGAGPQTAAVGVGGNTSAGAATAISNAHENYDGTDWTSKTVFPTPANWVGTVGTQTALFAFAGFPYTGNSWDGSSWTAAPANSLNRPNFYGGSGGVSATSAYIFAGYHPPSWANTNYTEHYDGTSWTTQPNLATARGNFGGDGASSNGLFASSSYPGVTSTEEFSTETTAINVKTLTQS